MVLHRRSFSILYLCASILEIFVTLGNSTEEKQSNQTTFESAYLNFPDIVELNVGGRHFTTSLTTLTKYPDSMLAAMFSGRHPMTKDKDGRYFIDVNGDVFIYVLDFLRLQVLPPQEKHAEVQKYAEYFGIEELATCLKDLPTCPENNLFSHLAANIKGYSEYLDIAKTKIRKCQMTEYIAIQISINTPVSCPHGCYLNCPHLKVCWPPEVQRYTEFTVIDITKSNEVKNLPQARHLLIVLAHDLKKLGIHLCHEYRAKLSPKYAMLFRVGGSSE